MIQIRYFLLFIACIAFTTAAWLMAENVYYKSQGERHSAVVVKTWHESSADFNYLKSRLTHYRHTNHAEIALIDNVPAPIDADALDTENQTSTPLSNSDIKSQLAERFKKNREELNKKLQTLKDSLKPIAIPENAPRYTIARISDKDANHLYAGRKINVFILNQDAKLDTQVENLWSEREQILILLGIVLLLLSFGLKFIKPS